MKYVLLKIQPGTIKVIEINQLQDLNYNKKTQKRSENLNSNRRQQIEELNKKLEELTRVMETIILKTEKIYIFV